MSLTDAAITRRLNWTKLYELLTVQSEHMSSIGNHFPSERRSHFLTLVFIALALPFGSIAQLHPGRVDPSFNPGRVDPSFNPGRVDPSFKPDPVVMADSLSINSVATDDTGNVLIGGSFRSFDGFGEIRITRLLADGSSDHSFRQFGVVDGPIYTIVPLKDGKILLGGDFTRIGAVARTNIVRLNSDGSIDDAFVSALWAWNRAWYTGIRALHQQADGKLLVAGEFTLAPPYFGFRSEAAFARLNSDGSADISFPPMVLSPWMVPYLSFVNSFTVLPDEKIVYAGVFDPFIPPTNGGIGKLNPDGSTDPGFQPLESYYSRGLVAFQPGESESKLLVGVGDDCKAGLIRLTLDGVRDNRFQPPEGVDTLHAVQFDGKVLVAWNGGITRLDRDGAFDISFETYVPRNVPPPGWPNPVPIRNVVVQRDGNILVVGLFTPVEGEFGGLMVRLLGGDGMPVPPLIQVHPEDRKAIVGQTTTFSARAFSYVPPRYQWLFNEVPLPNATNSVLTLVNVQPENAGAYALLVQNPQGSITSRSATLTVVRATPGSLVALRKSGDTFELGMQTVMGKKHYLEESSDLKGWSAPSLMTDCGPIGFVPFTGDGTSIVIPNYVSFLQTLFFRLRVE